MSNLENKEKNLNKLIDKLSNISTSYSQSTYDSENIKTEKNQLESEKKELEKKHEELLREQKYLKNKIVKMQEELNKKSVTEENFNDQIDELSQETETLFEEIEKWQI
jgi:peptidoglycan hydrolase CwlO-like protein|tara:strand:- start:158 stop:481 length:324 start_codon:yes stop_codon:yes gene_type:complete